MKIEIPAFEPMAKCNEPLRHGPISIDLGNDVVQVVRCGKCMNWDTEKLYCHHPAGLSYCGKKAAEEGFCCFGERRDNHA